MSFENCFIGGNVAHYAGGGRAINYGVTGHHILGLEVVLPTGEIVNYGGKRLISGEHGIAHKRKPYMHLVLSEDEINSMKKIKKALDPNLILNPGKNSILIYDSNPERYNCKSGYYILY